MLRCHLGALSYSSPNIWTVFTVRLYDIFSNTYLLSIFNTIMDNKISHVLSAREISARFSSLLTFPSEQIFCRADPWRAPDLCGYVFFACSSTNDVIICSVTLKQNHLTVIIKAWFARRVIDKECHRDSPQVMLITVQPTAVYFIHEC